MNPRQSTGSATEEPLEPATPRLGHAVEDGGATVRGEAVGQLGDPADTSRSLRPRSVRARSLSVKSLSKRTLALAFDPGPRPRLLAERRAPLRRSDCADGPRPCPFVSCRYHLFLDVSPRTGSIKLNFPDLAPWELTESCALDVADRGAAPTETVGEAMNLTRERVRQVELVALAKLQALREMDALRDYLLEGSPDRGPSFPNAGDRRWTGPGAPPSKEKTRQGPGILGAPRK